LFETVKLPGSKILIPGVIESKSNFIEHPELIADRISNNAKLVGGRTSSPAVIAEETCVGQAAVDPDVVWAKLAALAKGPRIATN
jgi:5-methyltetrahydropteroyltriglutamate--homocysteine methyltransferase